MSDSRVVYRDRKPPPPRPVDMAGSLRDDVRMTGTELRALWARCHANEETAAAWKRMALSGFDLIKARTHIIDDRVDFGKATGATLDIVAACKKVFAAACQDLFKLLDEHGIGHPSELDAHDVCSIYVVSTDNPFPS